MGVETQRAVVHEYDRLPGDADFQGTPLGWAIHGSEHGWYCRTGNYAATVELLLKAGAKLPEKTNGGTEAVNEVLRRYGAKL